MTCDLAFLDEALKEWRKLDAVTREQLMVKDQLGERLREKRPKPVVVHAASRRSMGVMGLDPSLTCDFTTC
jgi:mRNA-degrading endonuclease RelE of RelBE toxin-antitoxin system